MIEAPGNISNEKVQKATGKSWDGWVELIDDFGGANSNHAKSSGV